MAYTRREIPQEEIRRQREICESIRIRLGDRPRLALVDTYGCQQNESDSEVLRGYLQAMGYGLTQREAEAEVIAVNTCAVREHAQMRVFGNVGALVHWKRQDPRRMVVLCGCMAQSPEIRRQVRQSFRVVDLCFGPHDLWRFPELMEKALAAHGQPGDRGRVFEDPPVEDAVAEGLPRVRTRGVKAWLSVMNGCNNFCSYCIVPYVRGRERSRRPEAILREAEELVRGGCRDITLLGQNVNSYGRGLPETVDFADLLRAMNGIPGDFRIRFMTSHPKDATDKLFETMGSCEKCAGHLHLPVQSGSDRILRAMNRGYTARQYLDRAEAARRCVPGLVLTTDIIVGFPGETEEDFQATLDLVERVEYDSMFTFLYSRRPGTAAAALPETASRPELQDRFRRLVDRANAISARLHRAQEGKVLRVLIDGLAEGEYPLTSRTDGGRLVHLRGGEDLVGSWATARITGSNTFALFGERQEE